MARINNQTVNTQGQQSKNQCGRQPGDSSTNPVTVNQSYGKHTPAIASFGEDPPHKPCTRL